MSLVLWDKYYARSRTHPQVATGYTSLDLNDGSASNETGRVNRRKEQLEPTKVGLVIGKSSSDNRATTISEVGGDGIL